MSLTDKVALVTGASSGLGAAIAIKFAEEGAKVAIVGRNVNKLKNVSAACEKFGKKPLSIAADVTKEEDLKKIITETLGAFGKLDILVNNAGIADQTSIFDESVMEMYDKVLLTNLRSAVFLTHQAAKHLIETKGNVVNISSIAGISAFSGNFAYCVSKAGMDHFTRSIALELAPKGVRVNSVNPGPVKTDIAENMGVNGDEFWERMKHMTALGRVGESEEIADLVAFVASDRGRSITGTTLVSDNGMILKKTYVSSTSN